MEIELDGETIAGRIACPADLRPGPGQYLLASLLDDPVEALATPLFASGMAAELAPFPTGWSPGARLALRGPLGRGFRLPPDSRRVCLAACQTTPARLLPLAALALGRGAAVTLVVEAQPQTAIPRNLPAAVEVVPCEAMPEALAWADCLALDTPSGGLYSLLSRLNLDRGRAQALNAQVLVGTAMPCGGLAECGICAVRTSRSWMLACKDGPVFDLASFLGGSA